MELEYLLFLYERIAKMRKCNERVFQCKRNLEIRENGIGGLVFSSKNIHSDLE